MEIFFIFSGWKAFDLVNNQKQHRQPSRKLSIDQRRQVSVKLQIIPTVDIPLTSVLFFTHINFFLYI